MYKAILFFFKPVMARKEKHKCKRAVINHYISIEKSVRAVMGITWEGHTCRVGSEEKGRQIKRGKNTALKNKNVH